MIKKWSIKITICSVSGVVHMRWLMRRKFVFEILVIIKGIYVERVFVLKFILFTYIVSFILYFLLLPVDEPPSQTFNDTS